MRYFRNFHMRIFATMLAFGAPGCVGTQEALNPPQLVTARDSDMAIQLFMQATILLGRYYGFQTLEYGTLRDRSVRAGYNVIPFMPPISSEATPRFKLSTLKSKFTLELDENGVPKPGMDIRAWAVGIAKAASVDPHKMLLAYYVQTGWRAAQIVCRNYLVGLDEKNEYLDFLQREFNIGATLANASLIAAGANVTLRAIGVAAQWVGNQTIDTYQGYRFLSVVDRDAMRTLVEAAQSTYALDYLGRLSGVTKFIPGPPANSVNPEGANFVLFSDAIQVISAIEYQCTRSGIRGLLNSAALGAGKHRKMRIDPFSNALLIDE